MQQCQLRAKWLLCSTRFFFVREFIKTESATAVQRAFRLRFNIQPPTRKSICRWNHQFEQIGCLCRGKSFGRPRVSEENVRRGSIVAISPKCTTTHWPNELMSLTTLKHFDPWRLLKSTYRCCSQVSESTVRFLFQDPSVDTAWGNWLIVVSCENQTKTINTLCWKITGIFNF